MVRPPRQTCHRKGSAQIITTGMIDTTGSKWGTREKSRASRREQAWDGSTVRFRSTPDYVAINRVLPARGGHESPPPRAHRGRFLGVHGDYFPGSSSSDLAGAETGTQRAIPRFDRPWEVIENPVDTTPGRRGGFRQKMRAMTE